VNPPESVSLLIGQFANKPTPGQSSHRLVNYWLLEVFKWCIYTRNHT